MSISDSPFASLKDLKKDLIKQEKQKVLVQKQKAMQKKQHDEFASMMAELGVRPLQATKRVEHKKKVQPKVISQPIVRKVSFQALSDEMESSHWHDWDDGRTHYRPGCSIDLVRKLSRIQMPIQAHLDLHGLTVEEARATFCVFIDEVSPRNYTLVRIITGQGYGSRSGRSVLRLTVPRWLKQHNNVLAFSWATERWGGNGSLIVLLGP